MHKKVSKTLWKQSYGLQNIAFGANFHVAHQTHFQSLLETFLCIIWLFHIFWWMGKKKHFLVQKVLILNNNIVLCYLQTFWPVGLDYSETFKNMDISKKNGVTEILVNFSFWLRKLLQVSYSPNKLQYFDFMNVKFTLPNNFLLLTAWISDS